MRATAILIVLVITLVSLLAMGIMVGASEITYEDGTKIEDFGNIQTVTSNFPTITTDQGIIPIIYTTGGQNSPIKALTDNYNIRFYKEPGYKVEYNESFITFNFDGVLFDNDYNGTPEESFTADGPLKDGNTIYYENFYLDWTFNIQLANNGFSKYFNLAEPQTAYYENNWINIPITIITNNEIKKDGEPLGIGNWSYNCNNLTLIHDDIDYNMGTVFIYDKEDNAYAGDYTIYRVSEMQYKLFINLKTSILQPTTLYPFKIDPAVYVYTTGFGRLREVAGSGSMNDLALFVGDGIIIGWNTTTNTQIQAINIGNRVMRDVILYTEDNGLNGGANYQTEYIAVGYDATVDTDPLGIVYWCGLTSSDLICFDESSEWLAPEGLDGVDVVLRSITVDNADETVANANFIVLGRDRITNLGNGITEFVITHNYENPNLGVGYTGTICQMGNWDATHTPMQIEYQNHNNKLVVSTREGYWKQFAGTGPVCLTTDWPSLPYDLDTNYRPYSLADADIDYVHDVFYDFTGKTSSDAYLYSGGHESADSHAMIKQLDFGVLSITDRWESLTTEMSRIVGMDLNADGDIWFSTWYGTGTLTGQIGLLDVDTFTVIDSATIYDSIPAIPDGLAMKNDVDGFSGLVTGHDSSNNGYVVAFTQNTPQFNRMVYPFYKQPVGLLNSQSDRSIAFDYAIYTNELETVSVHIWVNDSTDNNHADHTHDITLIEWGINPNQIDYPYTWVYNGNFIQTGFTEDSYYVELHSKDQNDNFFLNLSQFAISKPPSIWFREPGNHSLQKAGIQYMNVDVNFDSFLETYQSGMREGRWVDNNVTYRFYNESILEFDCQVSGITYLNCPTEIPWPGNWAISAIGYDHDYWNYGGSLSLGLSNMSWVYFTAWDDVLIDIDTITGQTFNIGETLYFNSSYINYNPSPIHNWTWEFQNLDTAEIFHYYGQNLEFNSIELTPGNYTLILSYSDQYDGASDWITFDLWDSLIGVSIDSPINNENYVFSWPIYHNASHFTTLINPTLNWTWEIKSLPSETIVGRYYADSQGVVLPIGEYSVNLTLFDGLNYAWDEVAIYRVEDTVINTTILTPLEGENFTTANVISFTSTYFTNLCPENPIFHLNWTWKIKNLQTLQTSIHYGQNFNIKLGAGNYSINLTFRDGYLTAWDARNQINVRAAAAQAIEDEDESQPSSTGGGPIIPDETAEGWWDWLVMNWVLWVILGISSGLVAVAVKIIRGGGDSDE